MFQNLFLLLVSCPWIMNRQIPVKMKTCLFPFEGELWQLAAQNKEAQELTNRILKRFLLYIMKFCAHLYSFFETEACLLCLRCTAEAMDLYCRSTPSLYTAWRSRTLLEPSCCCYFFLVFLDWFTLSTVGMRFRLQQLLHVCISGQLVSHTSKRAFSVINSTVSENHAALQQSKPGEQALFTFFSLEDKIKSLLSKSHCEF